MNDDHPPASKIPHLIQQLFGLFKKDNSKADLKEYLQKAQANQIIDHEEASMIAGVLSVSEQRVRDVMLPKSKMVTLPFDMTFDETIQLVQQSGHSRFPVARDDDIVGILLAKDLLGYVDHEKSNFAIENIMRPVRKIPESKRLDMLLREFRLQRLHMVIVTNEYGDIAGLATIEDVLEEIVGDIGDEHDHAEVLDIKKIDERQYLVSALTEIDDFNDYFDTELDEETSDTIGGFVLSRFGYVPKIGEKVSFAQLNFTVKQADDRRVLALLVQR